MNENLEILTALLVGVVVSIFTFVFTASLNVAKVAWFVSFVLTFLAIQTFKEDN